MNYRTEYSKAKNLLDGGSYNLCAMLCGRILESILKTLLHELISHPDIYNLPEKIKKLLTNDFKKTTKLTLGKLILLIKRTKAIGRLYGLHKLDKNGLYSIDFDAMVAIRNKASHEGNDDSTHVAGADAYIIYGYLLKLWGLLKHTSIFESSFEMPAEAPNRNERTPRKIIVQPQQSVRKKSSKPLPKEKPQNEKRDLNVSEFVEICRNKSTGKFFVFLNEALNDEASFILPNGKVKNFPVQLFFDVEEAEQNILIEKKLLTPEQVKSLNSIKEQEKSLRRRKVIVRPEPKNNPEYIVKYRNMLKNPDSITSRMLTIIKNSGAITWKNLKKKLILEYGYKDSGSFGASLRLLELDKYIEIDGKGDDKLIRSLKNSVIVKKRK
jgi:hypothetical protein